MGRRSGRHRAGGRASTAAAHPVTHAWTSATLTQVAGGNAEHGAFVALNCTAYHGEQGLLAYQTATDRAEPQGYHQCATQAASRPPP